MGVDNLQGCKKIKIKTKAKTNTTLRFNPNYSCAQYKDSLLAQKDQDKLI